MAAGRCNSESWLSTTEYKAEIVHQFVPGGVYENHVGRYTVIRVFEKDGTTRVDVQYERGRRAVLLAEKAWEIHEELIRQRGGSSARPPNVATRAVLLDLDGTVIDSRALDGVRAAARQGGGWQPVYARLGDTTLADGFLQLLCELAGTGQVGVVTSAPRPYAERLLEHHGLALPVIVAYHDCPSLKPDPSPLLLAATRLGVRPSECVYVGDEPADEQAAGRAGMAFVGVAGACRAPAGGCMECRAVAARLRSWAGAHPAVGKGPSACCEPLVEGADDKGVYVLGPYYPKRYAEFQSSASPLILDLKRGRWEAIEHFRAELTGLIARDAAMVCMPSSQADAPPSGVRRLGQRLAAESNRFDATGLIRRRTSIPAAHQGGARSIAVHLDSCETDTHLGQAITSRRVVILDDVLTTGSSLDAALQMVAKYRPAEIARVAIGRTTNPDATL